jgi:hypothetical protein
MAETRAKIGKDLEKSLVAYSIPITGVDKEQQYIAPGAAGTALISNGTTVTYQSVTGLVSTNVSDGTNTVVENVADTLLFTEKGVKAVVSKTGTEIKVELSVIPSSDTNNAITLGTDGKPYVPLAQLLSSTTPPTWDDATNSLVITFADGSITTIPFVDDISTFISNFKITDGVTTTTIDNHGTVTFSGTNLIKATVTGSSVSYGIDTTGATTGQVPTVQANGTVIFQNLPTITADNGVSIGTDGAVELGGTLHKNTLIEQSGFDFKVKNTTVGNEHTLELTNSISSLSRKTESTISGVENEAFIREYTNDTFSIVSLGVEGLNKTASIVIDSNGYGNSGNIESNVTLNVGGTSIVGNVLNLTADNVQVTKYPNTRDDSVTNRIKNILYSDDFGTFKSASINSLIDELINKELSNKVLDFLVQEDFDTSLLALGNNTVTSNSLSIIKQVYRNGILQQKSEYTISGLTVKFVEVFGASVGAVFSETVSLIGY